MPPPPVQMGQEQSLVQKLGMGAMMGGSVGLTLGFIFGSFSIITRGAGPRGPWNTLAQYMMTSGGTFAFFMSIGSVIRTEGMPLGLERDAYTGYRRSAVEEGWRLRARWEEEKQRAKTRE